jgi:hypothetical protein
LRSPIYSEALLFAAHVELYGERPLDARDLPLDALVERPVSSPFRADLTTPEWFLLPTGSNGNSLLRGDVAAEYTRDAPIVRHS